MTELRIGKLRLKNRLLLAPMVDVTDLPYRIVCRRAGAAIAYTEMINIGAILNTNPKTESMLITNKEDSPVGLQVTGRNVGEFEELLKRDEIDRFDLIDINCGCPSSRIVGNESGSYLLKDPNKMASMIRVLKDNGGIVTAKIRLGFKKNEVIKISKAVEKAGADLLTVHARLATQRSSEPADWKEIQKVKKEIGIPVVGNGGIVNGENVAKILDICDGAMIAGAAIGNPLVFRECLRYLKTGKEREVKFEERIGSFLDYLSLAEKYDVVEMPRIKFLGGYFIRGFKGAAKARSEFVRLKDYNSMKKFFEKLVGG